MAKSILLVCYLFLLSMPVLAETIDMPYLDQEFTCITAVEADKYTEDFGIDVASFGGKELCNADVDTKKLFNDIRIVENGKFAGGENKLIRGFVDNANYYSWMVQQTRGVQRGNDVPWATAYNMHGYFTMQDGWAKASTLGRVGTFIHEARHTEGYMHIPCTHGPYQGSSLAGCDTNYGYGGSHAVEMEYYARVSVQGSNFHPVYKKMARLMAMARSNFVFNTIVMQPHEAVLAVSQDGSRAHFFDQGKWFTREVPQFMGRLKRTSFGAVLFNGLTAMSIELYKNSGSSDPVEDTYSYYKLLKETKNVKDFAEFNFGVKRYVVKITNDNKLAAYNFPGGGWGNDLQVPFSVSKTTTSIPGSTKEGLYLVSPDGTIYNYAPETQKLVSQPGLWDATNKDVITFKNQNLILRQDSKIYLQNSSTLAPWVETTNLYSGLVTVPVYDAFEVVKD